MGSGNLHSFDAGLCGEEPAKPSIPQEAIRLWQQIRESNGAISEYRREVGTKGISKSLGHHLRAHTRNDILRLRNHFRRRVSIHEEPPEHTSWRSRTEKGRVCGQ